MYFMKDADIKKYVKQVRKEANEDMKKYLGVLREDLGGQVKTVAEGFLDIKKTLNEHTKTLDSHTEQIGNILTDTMEIKSDLKQVKLDVKFDLDRKVNKKLFVDLERRMRVLEKK